MKLSQKRTCNGCMVEEYIPGTRILRCGIGFDTKPVYIKGTEAGSISMEVGQIPQEPCPKPLNYNEKSELPFMPNKKEVLEYFKKREHETNRPENETK